MKKYCSAHVLVSLDMPRREGTVPAAISTAGAPIQVIGRCVHEQAVLEIEAGLRRFFNALIVRQRCPVSSHSETDGRSFSDG